AKSALILRSARRRSSRRLRRRKEQRQQGAAQLVLVVAHGTTIVQERGRHSFPPRTRWEHEIGIPLDLVPLAVGQVVEEPVPHLALAVPKIRHSRVNENGTPRPAKIAP